MKNLRSTAILLVFLQVICILPFSAFAEDPNIPLSVIVDDAVGKSLSYLEISQNEYGSW
jgi:hypothetical protein